MFGFGSKAKRSKPLIVHIDDDAVNGMLVRDILSGVGFEVMSADSPQEGLPIVFKEIPDLILLDVEMPHMSGFQACAAIRANPATAKVPVVMLTGLDKIKDIEKALSLGANSYLTKPLDVTRLCAKVKEFVTPVPDR